MKALPLTALAGLLACAAAEESLTLPSTSLPALSPEASSAPVVGDNAQEPERGAEEKLSEGEARIRAGIVLQGRLLSLLSRIDSHDAAEAAVDPVMRFIGEFQAWAQGFAALPPLDDETRSLYERRYMPIIHELNERIRAQGERLASAEFYGSTLLPAALARLVTSMQ